ncbi:uncharacterized protein [Mobula birostris]|uniref:uncharacterized protein isoform X3 n=1 Tax=Mobula birostris TaxID=1983395 RepID=UPI003B28661F
MKQMHHCKQLLDQLQRQRLDGFLCDCTVVIGQLQFKAHRNVLAAFSSYFQAVYELSLVNDVVFLDHNYISSEGFQKLLDFVYTGNIHVDGSNVAAIHAAAAYLQMEDVRKSKLLAGDGCAESPDDREGNGKQLKMKPMCNMCGKMFSEASSLRRHMRIHKGLKPYVCQLCTKAFTQCNQLKTHVRTHTGEKPYQCDMCDKSFAQKCQLVFHNRMHHGEKKPYSCDVCNLQFATSSNLKIHARKHSGEKPYICDWCGQRFAQASTLTYHVRRHTGEKPYVCDTCGKAFAVSSSLITHARKHTGEKPYSCHLCNKSFISSGELNKHTRSHTGEKPFVCELCGNSYSDVKNLKKHNSKAHAVKRTDRSDEGMDVEQECQEDPDLNVPLSVSERAEQQTMLLPISDGPSLSTEHLLRPTTYPETQLIFLQQLY